MDVEQVAGPAPFDLDDERMGAWNDFCASYIPCAHVKATKRYVEIRLERAKQLLEVAPSIGPQHSGAAKSVTVCTFALDLAATSLRLAFDTMEIGKQASYLEFLGLSSYVIRAVQKDIDEAAIYIARYTDDPEKSERIPTELSDGVQTFALKYVRSPPGMDIEVLPLPPGAWGEFRGRQGERRPVGPGAPRQVTRERSMGLGFSRKQQ